MSKYYLMLDQTKCIGCLSCQLHCRENKNLPEGPKPGQIMVVGPKFMGDNPTSAHIFISCFHCDTPWCVNSCPTLALEKREDGIVLLKEELCVGCKSCIVGCPFGCMQWNPDNQKVTKCDLCFERVDEGQEPACVANCTTKCLKFGKTEDRKPNSDCLVTDADLPIEG